MRLKVTREYAVGRASIMASRYSAAKDLTRPPASTAEPPRASSKAATILVGLEPVASSTMRHTWSLVAGVVLAPLGWFLLAFGQAAMTQSVTLSTSDGDFLLGGLLIIGVGLILGLLSSLRTSPVAALATAVLYLGLTVYLLISPLSASDLLGNKIGVGSYDVVLSAPLHTGVLGAIGGMMLIAAFSMSRWRGNSDADPNAWLPPPPAPAWVPPSVSTPTGDTLTDRSS